MISEIGSTFLESFAGFGIETAKDHVKESLDEKALKNDLIAFTKSRKKFNEIASLSEEIDFDGLFEYIRNNFLNDAETWIFSGNTKQRGKARSNIIDRAIEYSGADTPESKQNITKFVGDCLTIYSEFFHRKLNKKYILLVSQAVDEVSGSIDDAKREILEAVNDKPVISIDAALQKVQDGNFYEVEEEMQKLLAHVSIEHPLAPYYGVDYEHGHFVSVPKTPDAKKKYPEKFVFRGSLRSGDKYFNSPDDNPLDYAYRHQVSLVMEVSEAKKYLGDMVDPYYSQVRESEHHEIEFKPQEFPPAFACQIKICDEVYFDYVKLRLQEIRDDGAHIVGNKEQGGHIFFQMIFDPKAIGKVDFTCSTVDATYQELLQYYKFIRALLKNKDLHVYVLESHADLIAGLMNENSFPQRNEAELETRIEYLERICIIEKYFKVKFTQYEDISEDDYKEIIWLSNLIRNGKNVFMWSDSTLKGIITPEFRKCMDEMDDKESIFAYQSNGTENLLGQTFSLSYMRYYKSAKIKDLEKLKKKLSVLDDGDTIKIVLVPGSDNTIEETLVVPSNLINPEIEIIEQ